MRNFLAILAVFISSISIVFAQTPVGAPATEKSPLPVAYDPLTAAGDEVSSMALIADVNIQNVKVVEEADSLTGSFLLTSNMGQVNDLVYGIIVVDKDGKLLTTERLGTVSYLKQGDSVLKDFKYTLPTYVSGLVSVSLLAENSSGLMLSMFPLVQKTLTGTSDFSCQVPPSTTDSVSCVSSTNTKITYSTSDGLLTERKFGGEYNLLADTAFSFVPMAKPGRHYVFINNTNTGAMELESIKTVGAYGKIQNVAIYRTDDDEVEVKVPVTGSKLNNSSVNITLLDDAGTVCAEANQIFTGVIVQFNLTPSCEAGIAKVVFTDANGQLLDTKTEPFSVITATEISDEQVVGVPEQSETKKNSTGIQLAIIIVLGFLAGLLIMLIRKRKNAIQIMLFIVVLGLSALPSTHVLAATFNFSLYSDVAGEMAWSSVVTINPEFASYSQGDVMKIITSGLITSDSGANGTGGLAGYYSMNAANTAPAFDGVSIGGAVTIAQLTLVPNDQNPHILNGSTLVTVPATMTAGNHTLRVFGGGGGSCISGPGMPCTGVISGSGSISFTVTGPTTGTINISSNRPNASWSINGPANYAGSGSSGSYANAPAGGYTITWGAVAGYVTPSPVTLNLPAGGTLSFPEGTYTSAPPINLNFI